MQFKIAQLAFAAMSGLEKRRNHQLPPMQAAHASQTWSCLSSSLRATMSTKVARRCGNWASWSQENPGKPRSIEGNLGRPHVQISLWTCYQEADTGKKKPYTTLLQWGTFFAERLGGHRGKTSVLDIVSWVVTVFYIHHCPRMFFEAKKLSKSFSFGGGRVRFLLPCYSSSVQIWSLSHWQSDSKPIHNLSVDDPLLKETI